MDLIQSPSPSVKIQIMIVNKLLKTKSFVTSPSNVLPLHLKQTFPPMIWIFTEGEGDKIKSRLPINFFSALQSAIYFFFQILQICPTLDKIRCRHWCRTFQGMYVRTNSSFRHFKAWYSMYLVFSISIEAIPC